ncbi:ABC transporter substrate-binding protein [Streptomyces sp. NPDC051211]|uniref:ABC transporter substrate-binding protein n=1 Tax=Streptomyces sp. NPDC051211 TaxID=3154643 RepID=UPI00344FE2BF
MPGPTDAPPAGPEQSPRPGPVPAPRPGPGADANAQTLTRHGPGPGHGAGHGPGQRSAPPIPAPAPAAPPADDRARTEPGTNAGASTPRPGPARGGAEPCPTAGAADSGTEGAEPRPPEDRAHAETTTRQGRVPDRPGLIPASGPEAPAADGRARTETGTGDGARATRARPVRGGVEQRPGAGPDRIGGTDAAPQPNAGRHPADAVVRDARPGGEGGPAAGLDCADGRARTGVDGGVGSAPADGAACPAGEDGPAAGPDRAGGAAEGGASEWLPPALRRLIAERSTRALELPAPEPTRITPVDPPAAAARPVTRRRLLAAGGALLAIGGPAAWFGTRRTGGGAPPPRDLPTLTLGLQADLSGPGRATGQAHERGMRLAVARHNARPDAVFRLALRIADDAGDATRAGQAAKELAGDPAVTGIVGPTWEAAVPALAAACDAADLTLLPVSVVIPDTSQAQWRTLCATRPPEERLGLPVIHYLSVVRRSRRTAVVEDEGGGEAAWKLVRTLRQTPPANGAVTIHPVPAASSDFGPAVRALTGAGAEAVVFAGTSPERAAALARALADAGFKGPRLGIQYVMEPGFLTAAGPAAEGWVIGSLFTDPLSVPAAAEFVSAHRDAYGAPPARWATEAHDAVGLQAAALTALAGDGRDRAGLSRRIFRTAHQGLAKPLAFDANTHSLTKEPSAHLYRVDSGAYRYLGLYSDVRTDP